MVQVALKHQTSYQYPQPVRLGPHLLRLRPAPHCPVPIEGYSLSVNVEHCFHWLQDPYGNFQARVTFPQPVEVLEIEVFLQATIKPVNPFDFFLEADAFEYPFVYEPALAKELSLFLETTENGPVLQTWLAKWKQKNIYITNFLASLNQNLHQKITYQQRLEAGIQNAEETLTKQVGSCRDTTWLLVEMLRHYGLAARFVSGYLIQLKSESNSGQEIKKDTADLHAWAEVYLPGAGWIGLDPTSGLLTSQGHIPLACTASPDRAAPVSGTAQINASALDFSFQVTRL